MEENDCIKKCYICGKDFQGYDNWWYGLCPACQSAWIVEKNDFFFVEKEPLELGRKTNKYEIFNCKSGDWLGEIAWYGAFRKFCFFAEENIVWDEKCLKQLLDFLTKLNNDYRKEKNNV